MDVERLANLRNRVMNFADGSAVGEWKGLIRNIGEMYKEELRETLSGGTLTTEINAAEVDIAALEAEFDARTDLVLK